MERKSVIVERGALWKCATLPFLAAFAFRRSHVAKLKVRREPSKVFIYLYKIRILIRGGVTPKESP